LIHSMLIGEVNNMRILFLGNHDIFQRKKYLVFFFNSSSYNFQRKKKLALFSLLAAIVSPLKLTFSNSILELFTLYFFPFTTYFFISFNP
jgi:hypothetical protein